MTLVQKIFIVIPLFFSNSLFAQEVSQPTAKYTIHYKKFGTVLKALDSNKIPTDSIKLVFSELIENSLILDDSTAYTSDETLYLKFTNQWAKLLTNLRPYEIKMLNKILKENGLKY